MVYTIGSGDHWQPEARRDRWRLNGLRGAADGSGIDARTALARTETPDRSCERVRLPRGRSDKLGVVPGDENRQTGDTTMNRPLPTAYGAYAAAKRRAKSRARLTHPCDTCPNYYPDDDDCGYCEKLEAYWDTAE